MDKKERSIAKAITWRIIASFVTTCLVYIVSSDHVCVCDCRCSRCCVETIAVLRIRASMEHNNLGKEQVMVILVTGKRHR